MRGISEGEENAIERARQGGKSRIYISGPITGTKDFRRRFSKAEKDLKAAGLIPVNPARITAPMQPWEFSHDDFMTVCMAALSLCDGIYLLKGYERSIGAMEELEYAIQTGMLILTERRERA